MSAEVVVASESSPTGYGVWLVDGHQLCATSPCCGHILQKHAMTSECLACSKQYPRQLGDYLIGELFNMKVGDNWIPWLSHVTGLPEDCFTVEIKP